MTHLSDFTFLARAIANFCILVWSIIHIYSADKFEALRWRIIKKKEVKSIMTILFLLSITLLLSYDVICTKIKYSEGFVVDPLTNNIISKPSQDWSPENKKLRRIANRILMLVYALENSAIFLLQNFWNYLANKFVNSKFITTWQFRINYVFIFITLIGFPSISIFLESSDDEKLDYSNIEELKRELKKHTYEEVIPELAATSCNLIVLIYGLMAHFKFSTLIKQDSGSYISDRLKYYRHMNLLLILTIALNAGSMVTFSIDALTDEQYLNKHKFTADLIAGIMNFSTTAFWIVWLLIFYPRSLHINGGFSKLPSPIIPMSEPPNRKEIFGRKNVKHIEIKIDSTTTTMKTDQLDESREYIPSYYYKNNNDEGNDVQNSDYVRLPSPLAANNKQVISYADSPKQFSCKGLKFCILN